MRWYWILLCCLPLGVVGGVDGNEWQASEDLKGLAELVRQHSQSIDTVSMEYEVKEYWNGIEKPERFVLRPSKVKWSYCHRGGMEKSEVLGYEDNSFQKVVVRYVFSWDGTKFYFWEQEARANTAKGLDAKGMPQDPGAGGISSNPIFPLSPLRFVSLYVGTNSYSEHILKPKYEYRIVGRDDVLAGKQSIKLESKRGVLWFDEESGAFLKAIAYLEPSEEQNEKVFGIWEVLEGKVVNGIWFPIQMRFTQPYLDGNGGNYVCTLSVLKNSLRMGERMLPEDFVVTFAPGTAVSDEFKNTVYNVPSP